MRLKKVFAGALAAAMLVCAVAVPFPRCGNGIHEPMQPDAGIKDGTL